MDTRLQAIGLNKQFGRLEALRNITFDVKVGEFVSVIGPSGCGKTTLLKVLGGLLPPSSGRVLLDAVPVAQCKKKGAFGFVFQHPVLLPWRTVLENIMLPLEILGDSNVRGNRENILDLVGLEKFAGYYPHQLSGGMEQRVSLARVLVYQPSLLLMDEPFGALDEISRERMSFELLTICSKLEPTVIFVTHNLNEAVLMSDRVIVMSELPARIVAIAQVRLPRPRVSEMMTASAFNETLKCVRELLHLDSSRR